MPRVSVLTPTAAPALARGLSTAALAAVQSGATVVVSNDSGPQGAAA